LGLIADSKFREVTEDGERRSIFKESAKFPCFEVFVQCFVEISAYVSTFTVFVKNTATTQEARVSLLARYFG
jgi:hypothetical protein